MVHKSLFILLFTAVTILGCSADQNSGKKTSQSVDKTEKVAQPAQDQAEITGTYWKLVTLQGKQVPMHEDQKEAHIILKPKEQKITGSGGCNVLNGTYKLGSENNISFSKIATTMMSCPDMETEQQFLKIFERTVSYRVNGDTLLLNDSNGKTLAKLTAASAEKN